MPSYGTVCVELFQGVVGLLENWYCRGTGTGTVGDTGTGHRRGAKRGHRVLQGCWKRSIGPDVELSMQLVVKNWKLGWELGNGECWSSQGEKQIQG